MLLRYLRPSIQLSLNKIFQACEISTSESERERERERKREGEGELDTEIFIETKNGK
jgi:hypothetical protein